MDKDKLKAIADEVAKIKKEEDAVKAAAAEQVAKEKEIEDLKAENAKLKAAPVDKKDTKVFSIGKSDMFKGYSLRKQFRGANEIFAPSNEEDKDKAVKEMLTILDTYNKTGRFTINSKAAMQLGTDGEGGYLVPETWANEVEYKAALYSAAMGNANMFTFPANTGELNIPKEGNGITVTWAAEEAANSESEPTVGNLQLVAKRGGFWGIMSNELMQDAGYDVVGYITKLAIRAMAQEIDNQVFNGTTFTSSLLTGVTTNDFKVGMTTSAAGAGTDLGDITALDLANMIQAIPASRRVGAKFFLPKEAMTYIRTLNNGSGGAILMDGISGVQSPTIYGYPFVEVDAISGTDTTAAQDFCLFGNMDSYALAMKLAPTSLELNPYSGTEFKAYQTLFRMYMRADGGVLHEGNFSLLGTAAD